MTRRHSMLCRLVVCASLGLCACATGPFAGETTGERFRKVLAEIDEGCRALKMGPYLDPGDPEYRNKRRATDCDILKLEPRDWRTEKMVKLDSQPWPVPQRWLETPEGRFAHSIRLPEAAQMRAFDMSGMSGDAIFHQLCDRSAGEHVFERVTTRGLVQARAFEPFPGSYTNLVFWTREKGDLGQSPQNVFVQPPLGEYSFLEMRTYADARSTTWRRFERGPESSSTQATNAVTRDGRQVRVPYVVISHEVPKPSASYGYTWRGILPGDAVEHGIEGHELIVYQVEPHRVLGVRRGFLRHVPATDSTDARMPSTTGCVGMRAALLASPDFVRAVVRPAAFLQ